MSWAQTVRERARTTLASAASRNLPPPFTVGPELQDTSAPVVVVDSRSSSEDVLPPGVRTAGAWAWRFILFVVATYLFLRVVSLLSVVIIPVVVAILLAALFQPASAALVRWGVKRSLAAGLVLVGGLLLVFGGLSLIVRTFISQLDTLSARVTEGIDEVQTWLSRGPLHLTDAQLSQYVEQARSAFTANQGAVTSGAISTAATLGEVVTGFFLVLFTLFFFLRDGAQIWSFLCRLLPREAQVPTARAGHYSWHTLVSYVHATVLVAFVDAVGIGIGLAVLRVPLALPLAALVFLGAFIPVIGATLTGAVAVLVALVANGPVTAVTVLIIVIAVQQLEGHVLQPLIMGRAVALHPLAVILAIAGGIVVAGIVGGLIAVPLLAVLNTAIRYLVRHPSGEPTPDREPPGTEPTDDDEAEQEDRAEAAQRATDPANPPPAHTSVS
ncbi:AI-2E family transporter [Actinoplanes philippinensis]|uniref:Predicted PurR-regulated permease PerM n=1 Tax=Actinoplanes philippinensis TaxID=35752 RepID=A0A1I2L6F1_9ACTN|nr:AI-2E family transporter [Actinoplanes philippinensis]GIE82439.1 AI-2E family transporter [Actinoplanes philippinensis]SFF74513.1 Predicted PurR-regulated permease PerM [Actinoplanes philippinensis]